MTHRMNRLTLSLGLLLVAAIAAGCGSSAGMRRVEQARWQAVPAGSRAEVERVQEPAVARALDEQRRAAAQEQEARQALARPATPAPAAATAAETTTAAPAATAPTAAGQPAGPDEAAAKAEAEWRAASRAHEATLAQARSKVDARKRAWQEANLRYRTLATRAANLHIEVVRAGYELAKAQSVSDHAPGDQPYDVSGYRGQFARREKEWSGARDRASQARVEHDQRLAELTAAKAEYAQVLRDAPQPPPVQTADSAAPAPARKPHADAKPGKGKPAQVTRK